MFSDSMVYECSELVGCYLGVNPPNAALESIANDFIRLRNFMDRKSLIDCVREPSKDGKSEVARINLHFLAVHEQLGHPIEVLAFFGKVSNSNESSELVFVFVEM